jgi:hypothetical protein
MISTNGVDPAPVQHLVGRIREYLKEAWDDQGDCASCGWHAMLYEHYLEDEDILNSIGRDGVLRIPCVSKNDDDPGSHRGIIIHLPNSVLDGQKSNEH